MKIMLKLIIGPEHVLKTLVIQVDPFFTPYFRYYYTQKKRCSSVRGTSKRT